SNDITYNSIALFPYSDFIDAGPGSPDAAVVDAGPTPDAGAPADAGGADAGLDDMGGGCGCTGGGPGAGSALCFVVWWLLRRRP
ncbi:MAG TPA: MYXO-CTERM sorting domain-containing protein, partial [Kofleriaceae bacterium]|nr:MYXO-CTERM sorting domain-containing protein [Kofleriaceae bacterium]